MAKIVIVFCLLGSLTKRITSELGNVSPLFIVPGKWSKSDMAFQARNVKPIGLAVDGDDGAEGAVADVRLGVAGHVESAVGGAGGDAVAHGEGLVANPVALTLAELRAFPKREQITQHFCIQGWSGVAKWRPFTTSSIERPGVAIWRATSSA